MVVCMVMLLQVIHKCQISKEKSPTWIYLLVSFFFVHFYATTRKFEGLDFSATSNMPTLIPQPNKVPPKEIEQKISVVEIKPPKPSIDETPKKEVIRVLPSKPLNNQEVIFLTSQITVYNK